MRCCVAAASSVNRSARLQLGACSGVLALAAWAGACSNRFTGDG